MEKDKKENVIVCQSPIHHIYLSSLASVVLKLLKDCDKSHREPFFLVRSGLKGSFMLMSFAKKLRGKAPLDTLQRECFLNSCSANYKEKWKLWAQKQDTERHLKMDEKSRCFRALLKIS